MENQPPAATTTARPWLRLGSIARLQARQAPGPNPPPATGPTPAPTRETTPVLPRPAPRIPVVPPPAAPLQPQPQPTAPPVPSQLRPSTPPTSINGAPVVEAQKGSNQVPAPPSPMIRALSKGPPQPDSPKVIKPSTPTSPENTRIRQVQPIKAPPPPPPYPEPEPKQQGNINGIAKTIAENNSKPLTNNSQPHFDKRAPPPPTPERNTAHSGLTKKDDVGKMKVITMAGENMGAYMELGSHHRQHNYQKQPHFLRTDGNESKSENGKSEDEKEKAKLGARGRPVEALVNSNVQSVNNSILLGSHCIQQNPGVHITFLTQRKPKHKGFFKKEAAN